MNKKYTLTIAIPTLNRLNKLRIAIDHIRTLVIPKYWNICLAISNIHSTDGTNEYLDELKLEHVKLYIYNEPREDFPCNWIYLSKTVPSFTDWVWFHGDDDFFIDPLALIKITNIIESGVGLHLLIVPQAKRISGTEDIIKMPLIELCNKFGYHEMLGWMSQLVFKYEEYLQIFSDYSRKYKFVKNNFDLNFYKISSLHHSFSTLNLLHNKQVALVNSLLIDEQISDSKKKQYASKYIINEIIRQRFFYVIDDLENIKNIHGSIFSERFFRYVNRDFRLLLLDISISDILSGDNLQFLPGRINITNMIPKLTTSPGKLQAIDEIISSAVDICNIFNSTKDDKSCRDRLELELHKCKLKYYDQIII